jgi:Zn-dependent peptidase ImmA (M78 family)
MTTVQTLNDSGKMNDRTILAKPFGYPSQKQKSCKASAQANAFAAHLLLPHRTQSPPTTLTTDKQQQPLEYEKNNTLIISSFYLLDRF